MPRRNKRKIYTTGKEAVFTGAGGGTDGRRECVGCAFAGYGGICTTSDGACLKTALPVRREAVNANRQR